MQLNFSFLIFFITFFTLHCESAAYKWTKQKIPNPFDTELPPMFCNLRESGNALCDPDRLLDPQQVDYILEKQEELARLGKCPCSSCDVKRTGLVVGFLIIKEYDDSGIVRNLNEVNSSVLTDFSNEARKNWNLHTPCDNSVVITIAAESKQFGVSIGSKITNLFNDTDYLLTGILEENFRNRATFMLFPRIKDVLAMYKEALKEVMKKKNEKLYEPIALSGAEYDSIWCTVFIISFVIILAVIISLTLFVLMRHRKENDDISLRDVWTKKFWLKAGNQYKEAKQFEGGNDKDIEKNNDEEGVKVKLASEEDLKNVDDGEPDVEYPAKLSKV